jgi:hypothetical protein
MKRGHENSNISGDIKLQIEEGEKKFKYLK